MLFICVIVLIVKSVKFKLAGTVRFSSLICKDIVADTGTFSNQISAVASTDKI